MRAAALSADGHRLAYASAGAGIRVHDLSTGREFVHLRGHPGGVQALAFSPDGRSVVSGGTDGRVAIWDLPPSTRGEKAELEEYGPESRLALLGEMAGAEAPGAYRAMRQLALGGNATVAFLRERLLGKDRLDAEGAGKLIRRLDDGDFQVRDRAFTELRLRADSIEPVLREALDADISPEVRFRLKKLLADLERPLTIGPGERLWEVRARQVLEWMGTDRARELLRQARDRSPR